MGGEITPPPQPGVTLINVECINRLKLTRCLSSYLLGSYVKGVMRAGMRELVKGMMRVYAERVGTV